MGPDVHRMLKKLVVFATLSVSVYLMIAVSLILSQWPTPIAPGETLEFTSLTYQGDQQNTTGELIAYRARDGADLPLRHFPTAAPTAPLAVILHGSGWHGAAYFPVADYLSQHCGSEVLLPDLRGHGVAPATRGDVGYIGAFEDDLADLIAAYRRPEQPVYMIGHSSGGGLVIRFAGGDHGSVLSKAVLLSPFLKYDAPTMRDDAGGWSHVLVRRMIGLTMLNKVGLRMLNRLTVIQFRFPRNVLDGPQGATATTGYSYRLNASFAPRDDYLADIAELPRFLLLAGADDEAFDATLFEPVMSAATEHGAYEILPETGHLDLIEDQDAVMRTCEFLQN